MISFEDNGELTVKTDPKVTIRTNIEIAGKKEFLPIEIVADFSKIPQSEHEIYYRSFVYKYWNSVTVYNNTLTKINKTEGKKGIDRIVDIITSSFKFKK